MNNFFLQAKAAAEAFDREIEALRAQGLEVFVWSPGEAEVTYEEPEGERESKR